MPKRQAGLTKRQRMALEVQRAHGEATVFAVGVSDYATSSGYTNIGTCANDALAIRDAFLDIHQLNAMKGRVEVLTSKGTIKPSRGHIVSGLMDLADGAQRNERIVFYYSGHGTRLHSQSDSSEFYLVPEDAYDAEDSDALLPFKMVLEILEGSDAKQKIVLIDACMSGPDLTGKKLLPAKYSKKFVAEYMAQTKGIAIISSSTGSQTSYTQSPNPDLSLFTHFLVKALRGDPDAVDDTEILTVSSLYEYVSTEVQRTAKSYRKKQCPSIHVKASGSIILGDFSQPIIPLKSLSLADRPVARLAFEDSGGLKTKEVLTEIVRWASYTQGYLEETVNDNLGDFLAEEFGRKRSKLRKTFGFSTSEVGVDNTEILFPQGRYYVEYEADDKRSGRLVRTLELGREWFARPGDIATVAECVDMWPEKMHFELATTIDPMSLVAGLEAKKWELVSELNDKVEATRGGLELTATLDRISLSGFSLSELFGDAADQEKAGLAYSVLTLLSSAKT